MDQPSPQAERRIMHRQRMLKSVKLSPDDKLSLFDGVVRDFCSKGARIKVAESQMLPSQFSFRFADDDSKKFAEIVWRTHKEIGVKFNIL